RLVPRDLATMSCRANASPTGAATGGWVARLPPLFPSRWRRKKKVIRFDTQCERGTVWRGTHETAKQLEGDPAHSNHKWDLFSSSFCDPRLLILPPQRSRERK